MILEKNLFEIFMQKAKTVWKYSGIQIYYDQDPTNATFVVRLRERWFYICNFINLTSAAISVIGFMSRLSIQIILYMIPCVAYVILGIIKSFYFLYYESTVRDIIKTLRTLQTIDDAEGKEELVDNFVKMHLSFLNTATKLLLKSCYMAIASFCIGPLVITGWQYWSTNEIHLFLPYTIWYPFDEHSYVGWPFAFAHQFWSAWSAVFFVNGPDFFYYICCAFVYNQFCSLQFDMSQIGPDCFIDQRSLHIHMRKLIHRHRELIRCVNMINVIFGKSSLFNVVSSSFLICLAGFNVIVIDNLILMSPFVLFVVVTIVQIFLLCYYGDLLMQASLGVSDAMFCSKWYKLNASSMKCCLFMIMRSQKPCIITAIGFRDINMKTFAKIISSAWSYFTLIKTMYTKQNF